MLFLGKIASAQVLPMGTRWVGGVTDQWKNVNFGQNIADPIVVIGPLSNTSTQPAGGRLRNVTSTGFQVRVQEWDSQDGVHGWERLSYLVMKRGRYVLGNGKVVLATSTSVSGGGYQSKTFSQPFRRAPIILATVVTQTETDAVAVQIRNVTTTGFQIRLREQEANSQAHVAETVHFLAWEPGAGTINGFALEVGTRGVSDAFARFGLAPPLPIRPFLLQAPKRWWGRKPILFDIGI